MTATVIETDQAEVVAFLCRGASFGLSGAPVERIETHAATIFLIGARAYKMKRAVRYSFLDFSTLAKRRAVLEAELRLNRRTAPKLYRRVLPVTRTNGELALDGPGEAIEWLLEMERFDQAALLDHLADRGELTERLIDELAQEIVDFHATAEICRDQGGHAGMAEVIEGNAKDLDVLAGSILPPDTVEIVNRASLAELNRCRELLERRRQGGHVRHCHGDLHLGNIVLLDGRPVLFDCLEFDEALASIDTFYDLAFLVMDLSHRGLGPLAQRLLNGYLDATGDDDGVGLLPLFLSCRAAIRAKVQGFSAELKRRPIEREREVALARNYLDQALAFLEPAPPQLVALGGVSGTGKSTLARRLAPQIGGAPGSIVLRSDVVRKQLLGVSPTTRLDADAYRREVSEKVYARLAARAATLVAAGQAVIVDAVFLDPSERLHIERVAAAAEIPFRGLWLQAPAEVLAHRIDQRRGDASDATVAVLEQQLAIDPGPITWTILDVSESPAAIACAARGLLRSAVDQDQSGDRRTTLCSGAAT